ncbi:MAG: response regulator transcription factor [Chloroflexota bacterium]
MSKIAIIDDDPDIVEALSFLLTAKGYDVVAAVNVDDALSLVESSRPDVIILDVMMVEPDDGFYLANKFRKLGIEAPIIMLTSVAKVTGYEFAKSERLPVQEFLEKPISAEKLLEYVSKYAPIVKLTNSEGAKC